VDNQAKEKRMDEKTKELYEMFKVGIENERRAQEFYKVLIEKSSSDLQKKIFTGFLQEEEKHEQELMEAYGEIKEKLGLS
jgi:rubrerythrin